MQALIDAHIVSLGIDPRIPPIAITDAKFFEQVQRQVSPRAKASEMEHAIRHHIKKRFDEDPVFYQTLSQRLEEVIQKHGNDWEQLVLLLTPLVEEAAGGRKAEHSVSGLDPQRHAPFFDVLREERTRERPVHGADVAWLAALTVQVVDQTIRPAIRNVGFWKSAPRQQELHSALVVFLDDGGIVDLDRAEAVADRLMELAKANHAKLVAN